LEKCDLIPQKDCRIVSALLPSLQPEERCMNVSKEVCTKVLVQEQFQKIRPELSVVSETEP